jgi:hypothetical protein
MTVRVIQFGMILAAGLAVARTAMGAGDGFDAPTVAEPHVPWAAIAYAIVGLVGICVLAFRKSRRSTMK